MEKISPDVFLERFNAPVGQLEQLIQAKTVSISRLMEIAPQGITKL